MRFLKTATLTAITVGFLASPAVADENDSLCSIYSKTGGAMSEFMLPLTVQDFINMMNGTDQTLMEDMVAAMVNDFSGADLLALSKLKGDDGELIGEAAGQVAIELLMSGQASTKADVSRIMKTTCKQVGARRIINNQRRANAATQANMGQ